MLWLAYSGLAKKFIRVFLLHLHGRFFIIHLYAADIRFQSNVLKSRKSLVKSSRGLGSLGLRPLGHYRVGLSDQKFIIRTLCITIRSCKTFRNIFSKLKIISIYSEARLYIAAVVV